MWALKCLRTRRHVFVLYRRLTPAASPAHCRGLRRRCWYLITPRTPPHTSSVAVCLDVNCAAHRLQLCINTSMGADKVTNQPIAKCVAAAARLSDAFDLTATTSLPLR